MITNTEDIIKALCIIGAGFRTKDEEEVYKEAVELINRNADYIHLLKQKEKLDDKISYYSKNK